MLPVTTRPTTSAAPLAATITTLAARPDAVLVRQTASTTATRPTSARRPAAATTPVSRPVYGPLDWAAVQRRRQRQRALLLAFAVVAALAAIAVLGFAAANTGLQLPGLLPAGAVVLAIALWLRRPRRCPGVVVHCPSTRRRH